jgi:SAM-dependent methyltransferase
MKVLNVGGANRLLPERFEGWEQTLLDIDPNVKPDICMDAKEMTKLPPDTYDAVLCSHNLEHFFRHEVPGVLAGFRHVLKEGGIVDIVVPNIGQLLKDMMRYDLDIDDIWYRTTEGLAITFHEAVYGWNWALCEGNNAYYAHKCGFTGQALYNALSTAGFKNLKVVGQNTNLLAIGYK